MKKALRIAARFIEGISSSTGGIASLSIVAAALIITEGVIARKVFGVSTIWQIEASVFLLIFACFVGSGIVQKNEHHLNVDLVLIYLTPKTREILLIVVSIITCVLAVVIAWYSWPMWWESVIRNDHSESMWGPPLWIPYVFLPFGMTLLFFQYIVYIVRKIDAVRKGEIAEEAVRLELRDIEIETAETQPDSSQE